MGQRFLRFLVLEILLPEFQIFVCIFIINVHVLFKKQAEGFQRKSRFQCTFPLKGFFEKCFQCNSMVLQLCSSKAQGCV